MVVREQQVAHQGRKRLALVPLATGQVHPNRDAVAFDQEMDLGAETASRVAQRMLRRLHELPCFWPDQPRQEVGIFFPPRRQRG